MSDVITKSVVNQSIDLEQIFNKVFRVVPDFDQPEFVLFVGNDPMSVSLAGLNEAMEMLLGMTTLTKDALISQTYFEHVVDDSKRIPGRMRKDLVLEEEHGTERYRLGAPSGAFMLNALNLMQDSELSELAHRLRFRISRGLYSNRRPGRAEADETPTWNELISATISSLLTVSVEVKTPKSEAALNGLFESFIFHVSFNAGRPLLPRNSTLTALGIERSRGARPGDIQELDIPRRSYVPELVYHYQLGLSSESPVLSFLSFYHVLEHWFENVFMKDLTFAVQELITAPRFSFKRNDDLKKLIREITRQAQVRNEEMIFSEEKALTLTLMEYVDLNDLGNAIDQVDPLLREYLRAHKVPFSDGRSVDFREPKNDTVYKALSNRIYQTRNALVHSKDNGKKRFRPFKSDSDLIHETKLLQVIAELVIINSSELKK